MSVAFWSMFAPGRNEYVELARRIFCAAFGHSKLRDMSFGYHYCARCGAVLGDSLGGVYSDPSAVYIHHMHLWENDGKGFAKVRGCHCPTNAVALRFSDRFLVPRYNSLGYASRPPWTPKPGSEAVKPPVPSEEVFAKLRAKQEARRMERES